jgi:uncharacterized delta-60 repeat protein
MNHRSPWIIKFFIITILLLSALNPQFQHTASAAASQPGGPDLGFAGFGQGGRLSTAPLDIRAAGLQSDGKLVVAGNQNGTFAMARYLPDGRLDTTFGNGGLVMTAILSTQGSADATALSIDFDRIVLAGRVEINGQDDFAVARYNPDGTLDHTFGANGIAHSDFNGGGDIAWAVKAILGKGVLVAGVGQINGKQDCVVERFTEDGSLDLTFHFNGKVVIDFGGNDACYALSLQADTGGQRPLVHPADDKILVAGASDQGSGNDFAIARLNWDGSPDTSFDGDGKMTLDLGGDDIARAVAVQGNLAIGGSEKIIVAGEQHGQAAALVSLRASDGQLNTNFAGQGVLLIPLGGSLPGVSALVIQPDDKIVLAGRGQDQFALLRFKPDGSPDPNFGADGLVLTDFGPGNESARALALRSDGELLAAGLGKIAAYFPDGSLDAGGRMMTVFSPNFNNEDAFDLAVQADTGGQSPPVNPADGKIILAGGVYASLSPVLALSRYNPDGSLDPSFSGDGLATFPSLGAAVAQAVAIQPASIDHSDGKIVVAGQIRITSGVNDLLLMRLNSDGTLDATCGLQGIATANFSGSAFTSSLAFQADGKILLAGSLEDQLSGDYSVWVTRYNPDCTPDEGTFGQDGIVLMQFTSRNTDPRLLPLPDGKILIVNQQQDGFALVRLTAGGEFDDTFGPSGRVTIQSSVQLIPSTAVRQPSGRVVVAGYTSNGDLFLAGILPNGSLDPSFGLAGLQISDFGGREQAFDLAVRPDGTLATTGRSYQGAETMMFLAQYSADGTPDPAFGSGGHVLYPGARFYLSRLAFAGSNRIALSGQYSSGYDWNFFLAQYLTTSYAPSPAGRLFLPITIK